MPLSCFRLCHITLLYSRRPTDLRNEGPAALAQLVGAGVSAELAPLNCLCGPRAEWPMREYGVR
jgi:hypothetical protein